MSTRKVRIQKNGTDYLLSNFIRTFVDETKQHKVAHKLPRGTNEPLRFTIEEMYLLRQFFKEYGSDASFDELYEFNEDLYLDNAEILLDIICSRLNTVYLEEEMMLMDNISLDDYTVIWPESLINDVLDDNLLDWKAIEAAEEDTDDDDD